MGYAGKFDSIYDSSSFPEWELYSLHADEGLEVRTPVSAGRHMVGLSFHRRPALPEGILPLPLDRSTYSFGQNEFQEGYPGVSEVQIIGPFDPTGAAELPSRDRLFACEPTGEAAGEEACARTILLNLARQAYRRPATAADVETLLPFYRDGSSEGGFDAGIQAAVERLLVDPEFPLPHRDRPAGRPCRHTVPHHRPGAGIAPVVLPVEQHPRRRIDRSGNRGQAERAGGARPADRAYACRPARDRAGRELRGPVAAAPQAAQRDAGHGHLHRVRREPARGDVAGGPSSSSSTSCGRTGRS